MESKISTVLHGLELNKRMQLFMDEEEVILFRHIRCQYQNRTLPSMEAWHNVLNDLRQRIDAINESRRGKGPYLHIDAALPTDLSDGWIKLTYLNVRKAQARLTITEIRGEIQA